MAGHIRKRTFITCVTVTLLPALAGCAARVVKPGDEVTARFTCRLPNGEIAVSTSKSTAENPSLRKSVLFRAPVSDAPVRLKAGIPSSEAGSMGMRSYEDEVLDRLSLAIAGGTYGARTFELSDNDTPASVREGHLLRMPRVKKRPKEMRMKTDAFRARAGEDPRVGAEFTVDPAIPGKVTSVNADEVVIGFFRKPGDVIDTPFGKGTVRDAGDSYEIIIDVHPGDLVRSGPLVGRVTRVDDREFTIDYGLPLGGETLSCDVRLAPAAKGK